jgi:RNA polymerase sigma factor (sigma-70 family)
VVQLERGGDATSNAADAVVRAYEAWAPGLYRYVRTLIGDVGLAEDVLHEAFLRLHQTLVRGETIDHPRAWLHVVARRLVLDALQSYGTRHAECLDEASTPRQAAPPFEDEPASRWQEVWRLGASELSPRERECLQLCAEGFTRREIAGILQLRTGTVCTLVARGIRKVRRRVLSQARRCR